MTRGTVVGSLLFGIGWSLAGMCPGPILVNIGEGKVYAVDLEPDMVRYMRERATREGLANVEARVVATRAAAAVLRIMRGSPRAIF